MRELTQTSLHPHGNCWQTCVACILDLDPEVMPPQSEYDWRRPGPDGKIEYGPQYMLPLQAYLRKHHGLGYLEMHSPPELFPMLRVADPGWHLMTGRTVRSDQQNGDRHVVVGRYGQVVWDPHPSRAGLLEEIRWALLVPFPQSWEPMFTNECVCQWCAQR
jgi:hypothetical protein